MLKTSPKANTEEGDNYSTKQVNKGKDMEKMKKKKKKKQQQELNADDNIDEETCFKVEANANTKGKEERSEFDVETVHNTLLNSSYRFISEFFSDIF